MNRTLWSARAVLVFVSLGCQAAGPQPVPPTASTAVVTPAPDDEPPVVEPPEIQALAAGQHHVCARWSSGVVSCWGASSRMQLGRNDESLVGAPARVPGLTDVVQIGAGSHTTCARLRGGTIRCWGSDLAGMLGDGDDKLSSSCSAAGCSADALPVQNVTNATHLEVGGLVSCADLATGERRCWGNNEHGFYRADGPRTLHQPEALAALPPAVQVATNSANACGVKEDGEVWCIGFGAMGQLGDGRESHGVCRKNGAFDCTPEAVKVEAVTSAVQVTLGNHLACARLRDGRVSCWGRNDSGQLGDGVAQHASCRMHASVSDCARAPVMVADVSDATHVACGHAHCCSLSRDGTVRCWGDGESGQLGVATPPDRCADDVPCSRRPVRVANLPPIAQLSLASWTTCALSRAGEVLCWGAGGWGQLGDGRKARCRSGGDFDACSSVPLSVPIPMP